MCILHTYRFNTSMMNQVDLEGMPGVSGPRPWRGRSSGVRECGPCRWGAAWLRTCFSGPHCCIFEMGWRCLPRRAVGRTGWDHHVCKAAGQFRSGDCLLTVITLIMRPVLRPSKPHRAPSWNKGARQHPHAHSAARGVWERGLTHHLCMGRMDQDLQQKPVSQWQA